MLNLVVNIVTTVSSEMHTKHINTLFRRNVEFLILNTVVCTVTNILRSTKHTHTLCG
jgi:hypothetical protein